MKVLLISTSESGGASVAAERLSKELKRKGAETHFLTRSRYSEKHNRRWLILSSKANTVASRIFAKDPYEQIAPVSVAFLNLRDVYELNPDVIHIHNWFNFLSIDQLDELISNFPTVFTMHDIRLLTGGCFFTNGCKGNIHGCINCPATNFFKPLVAFSHRNLRSILELPRPLRIISPSRWLADQVKVSHPRIANHKVHVIPNYSNLEFVDSSNRHKSKIHSKTRMIFIASDIAQPLKGLSKLLEAIREFEDTVSLAVVGAGNKPKELTNTDQVEYLGKLNSEQIRIEFSKSDVLIVPSSIENRPNVIVEAQLAGLFVMASNVGGIPELIENNISGLLFEPNLIDMRDSIRTYLKLTSDEKFKIAKRGHDAALASTDTSLLTKQYFELYEQLMHEFRMSKNK